jgi:phage repressor protein C with HTH and peptisase S24 domain
MYRDAPEDKSEPPRLLRLYDIPVSAGAGNFLDESGYEMIETPDYIPAAADFALRVSGDSMEPLFQDGQVIWVKEHEVLNSGEIGIFTYSGDVYCKKLILDSGKAYLRSLNPEYEDIDVKDDFGFKTIGKVVS